MKPKVFVTRRLPEEALALLEKECHLEVFPHDRVIKREELLEKIKDKDGILVMVTDSIDREVIEASDRLKIIAGCGEGYNHIDVGVATAKNILVTNTPSDDIAVPVAETTIGLLLAVSKRIVEGDKSIRTEGFKGWAPLDWWGADLAGQVFGIVGLGRIGKEVAKRLQGWGMQVLYHDPYRVSAKKERELNVKYVPLNLLFRESDFISLHVPLSEKTHHLIGEAEFNLMKSNAFLINASRGAIIEEGALIGALWKKIIAGAALDVFEYEPDIPSELLKLDNVVLTPHLAGATWRARVLPAMLAARNLLAGVKGEIPPNIVNPVR